MIPERCSCSFYQPEHVPVVIFFINKINRTHVPGTLWQRCRSREIWRDEGLMPEFPQTFPKIICVNFAYRFSPTKIMKTFFGMISKIGGLHVFFCKRWAPFLEVKQYWAPFLHGFSEILLRFSGISPGFSTNQNFRGCACTPRLLHHCSVLRNLFTWFSCRPSVARYGDFYGIAMVLYEKRFIRRRLSHVVHVLYCKRHSEGKQFYWFTAGKMRTHWVWNWFSVEVISWM